MILGTLSGKFDSGTRRQTFSVSVGLGLMGGCHWVNSIVMGDLLRLWLNLMDRQTNASDLWSNSCKLFYNFRENAI